MKRMKGAVVVTVAKEQTHRGARSTEEREFEVCKLELVLSMLVGWEVEF